MKKILSFGLMLLMSITAWAGKLYFVPNSNWAGNTDKYAAYYFNESSNGWSDLMTAVEGSEGTYETTIPDGNTTVIFVALDKTLDQATFSALENKWSKKWNQTADITLETGKDLFTLADGWDNISGTWSVFTTGETGEGGEGGEEGGETEVASYYLVGNFNSWDIENSPAFTYNEEAKTYTISIDRMFGEFKVATTLDWNSQNYGAAQEGDVIALEADYTLQARFDDGNSNLAVSGTYTNAVFRLAQTDKGLVLTFVSGTKEEEVKVDDTTIYFVNTTKATAVNAYVWQADENNTTTIANHKGWPGEAMTKTEAQVNGFDVYSYTFPENFNWVIFITDGDQTTEILRDATKAYYNDGTWYASLEAIPVPETPAKFYIIGDDALLGEGNAWNFEKAIKVTEDSYTMSLAAGTYSMKVLTALNWDAAVGYSALSEKAEGLTTDDTDNIIFTLAEAGDVVVTYAVAEETTTFVVNGNFYVEPVVEPEMVDLRIVPNMWSEADAKIAAWVWGENLAGEWTSFFAGEGDTLSVKVNAEADSIIFVRMNAEAEVPGWEAWNRMANMEIGASMVFTVTDWAAGTWEVYVPETPAKFYIIGDDALLGEGNAWNLEKAIKVTEDSYTMSLAAGTYSMKVLTALNWDAAVGYSALSEKAEGLTTDDTDNIIFTLAEAGDVVVTYAVAEETTTFTVSGNFYVEQQPEPKDITIYFVNIYNWTVVNAYVYYEAPAEGVAGRRNVVAQTAMDWPGEAMTKTEEQINGYDVYTYTFTDDNNMFIANNGGSGEGNQTGNIVVDAAKPYIYGEALYATAEDIPAECSGEYGLIVNGTFVAAELNTEAVVDNGAEYMITTTLAVGDVVALYDNCNLAQWVLTPRDDSYSSFTTDTEAQTYTITEAGTYAFYIRIYNGGTSDVYVVYTAGGTTALTEVMNNADKATKVIVNGQLYIVRDGVMYNAQGAVVR